MAKKKTVRRGERAFKKDLQAKILEGVQRVSAAAQNSLQRSAGLTFRIGYSELVAHFKNRETYWNGVAKGLEDGTKDLGMPDHMFCPPRPIGLPGEFATEQKENAAEIAKYKQMHLKAVIQQAKDRAAAFRFMALHLDPSPEFVVDIDMAARFDLAPAFDRYAQADVIGAMR